MNQQPNTTPQPLPSTPTTPQLQSAAKTPTSSPPTSSLWPASPPTPESDLGIYSDTTPSTAGVSSNLSLTTTTLATSTTAFTPASCVPYNQPPQPSSSSSLSPTSNIPTLPGSTLDRPSRLRPRSPSPPVTAIESHLHHCAPVEKLLYDIHAFSSHSPAYHPHNILVDKPTDQGSRWSSGANNHLQYITIKLDKMAIVHSITFGKFHKVHVCNLKEFKIFGGLSPDNMTELLHTGLKNNSEPETFPLKHRTKQVIFPLLYIKIVPLVAYGPNFNFSIWYVELQGVRETDVVSQAHRDFINYRETESIRLCLKHLRQRNLAEAFDALSLRTGVTLEEPMLTDLHVALVSQGDFEKAEEIMRKATQQGVFESYIKELPYKPVWKRIWATDKGGQSPCMRGGHQMCIDVGAGRIYLLGGWNGVSDLADFWCFDVTQRTWKRISEDTRVQGGPGPRSCHKICFDPCDGQIYVFGRYVDPQSRADASLDPDFYRYDVMLDAWHKISGNTAKESGPELIYDHQMQIDPQTQTLYVFGGRTVQTDANHHIYSGLYAYNISNNHWKLVRADTDAPSSASSASTPTPPPLRSRIGHSMLLDPTTRLLYIFAGQRHKDYWSDLHAYDLDADRVIELSQNYSKEGGPDAGFTQRATIDVEAGEFYVLSGLMREKGLDTVKNSFWVYDIKKARWRRVYQNENVDAEYWKTMGEVEPCPRFAHQLVYDSLNKVQYLFGGNPGDPADATKRLDDFWELHLVRPKSKDILRRCLFYIRAQHFAEMCAGGASTAATLTYLRTELSAVVDHENETEGVEFRGLTTRLVQRNEVADDDTVKEAHKARTQLYERLLDFFPDDMTQPKDNLIDLVQIF